MEPDQQTRDQWRRVCDVSSLLLDSPRADWESILAQECGADIDLQTRVLEVCGNYSEADDFLGTRVVSPLALEDSHVGRRIGNWKVLRLLGEGGMGRVYLVKRDDGVFTQYAALKLNRSHSDPASLRRFHSERVILAMLEHPSIARAIDGGETAGGASYLVMEYVEGGVPIDEFRPESPVRDKIRLFLQVVEAVEAAHRHKIAHRDLKPANILVTPGGLPKVLDFGIAKLFGEGPLPADQTNTGHAALTPTYASPEQLLQQSSSLSSDIYSLGAVLYKMLTGRPPHDLTGLNILQSVQMVTESDPVPPSSHTRKVDASADAIVRKALERSPERRYGSVSEFADDLRRYLDDLPVNARKGALGRRVSRFLGRHRGGAAVAAVCLVLLAVAAAKPVRDWRVERARIEQLRRSAGPIIAEYQSQLAKLSVSSALRDRIASDEKKYLDGMFADAANDPELRRQSASAYGFLATYQSDRAGAQESLRRSMSLWREISNGNASTADRLEMAGVARRLGLSQTNMGKLKEAGASLEEGLRLIDSLTGTSSEKAARSERVMLLFELSRLGAWAGNGAQAIGYAQKAVAEHEQLPAEPLDRHGIALTRIQLADAADTYGSGDPKLSAEALRQTRLAVRAVRDAPRCDELSCREVKAAVLTRAPVILIHHGFVEEALALRDGVDLAEALLAEDPGNQSALTSLRFGLFHLGWALKRVGRLEECLRVRRRLLEISMVSGRNPGPAEDRLKEAIACGEVGRVLVDLNRLGEARGYFERQAEILAHPPTENVYWFMRQTDVHQDLGMLQERLGRHEAARAEFAKASAAAETFLAKTGSTRAKAIEAEAHYLQGKALLTVDKAAGCGLLRSSLDRYGELMKTDGHISQGWQLNIQGASKAARTCRF